MKIRLWALTVFAIILTTVVEAPGVANQNKSSEKTRSLPREERTAKALLSPEAGTVLYLNMGFKNKLGIEEWGNFCRWRQNNVYYKWGPTLSDPNDNWRVAYSTSISDWNAVTNIKDYFFNTQSENSIILDAYDRPSDDRGGVTTLVCNAETGEAIGGTIWVNKASGANTANKRRTLTGHELGHGLGVQHAAANVALMYRAQVLGVYFVPQTRDIELVNEVHNNYP